MTHLAPRVIGVLLAAMWSAPATAQNANLPDDVRNALVRGPGVALTEDYTVLSDLPPGFPRELLPPGAEVRGAAISGSVTAVIAVVAARSEPAQAAEAARLAALGWMNASMAPSGFIIPSRIGPPATYCRGSDFAYVGTMPRPAGGTFVRISIPRDAGRPCMSRPSALAGLNVPRLLAPEGARQTGGGGGGSTDSSHTYARIEIDRSRRDLHDHYLRQLTEAGWQVQGRRFDDDTASISRLVSTQGERATAVLIVMELAERSYDVMLRVMRNTVSQPPRMNPIQVPPPPR